MIVKNEEEVLARCLDSIKNAVDEIIIIDTGSTDKTKQIAEKYTNRVYDFEWINDFSAARNEAFSKATCDYQMWLDADDIFPKKSLKNLIRLKKTLDPTIDIVTMKYITHFDKNGIPILSSTRERLLRREKNYQWQDPVHECIPLIGNVFNTDIEVHHKKEKHTDSRRNLDIYINLEKSGTPLTPRQQYYYARELKDHGFWVNAVYYFEKFLESEKGWFEDNIATCYNLSICYNALGDNQKKLPILIKSFAYDSPRAEICCEIGYYYKHKKQYATALNWFTIAINLGKPNNQGFILADYWGYIPSIECAVCHYHLGNIPLAIQSNENAAKFKPNAPAVQGNREFFSKLINKSAPTTVQHSPHQRDGEQIHCL